MSICRARAFGTWRIFEGGVRTRSRATAHMPSSKSFRRTSWPRFSPAAGELRRTRSGVLFRSAPGTPFTPLARRIVIRVGRLLRRPERFRHMAEVHADAGPGGRPTPHGVDQHVVHR